MEFPGNFSDEKCETREAKEREQKRSKRRQQAEASLLESSSKHQADEKDKKTSVAHDDVQRKTGKKSASKNASSERKVAKKDQSRLEVTKDIKMAHQPDTCAGTRQGPKSHLQDLPPVPLKGKSSRETQEDRKPPKPSPQVPSTSGVSGIPHVPRLDLTWLDSGDDQEDSKPPKTTEGTSKDSWSSSSSDDSDLDHSDWIVDMLMDGDSSDDEGEFVSIISTMKKDHTQATVESVQDVKTCPEKKTDEHSGADQHTAEEFTRSNKKESAVKTPAVLPEDTAADESNKEAVVGEERDDNEFPKTSLIQDTGGDDMGTREISHNGDEKYADVSQTFDSKKDEDEGNIKVDTIATTPRYIVNGIIEELVDSVAIKIAKSAGENVDKSGAESRETSQVSGKNNGSPMHTDSPKNSTTEAIVSGIIENLLQVVITGEEDSGERDSGESSSDKDTEEQQSADTGTEGFTEAGPTNPATKAAKARSKSELKKETRNPQPRPPTNGRPSTNVDSVSVTRHSRARQRRRDRSMHTDNVPVKNNTQSEAANNNEDAIQNEGETKALLNASPTAKRERRLPTLSRERVPSVSGVSDPDRIRSTARARRRDADIRSRQDESAHRQKEQRRSRTGKAAIQMVSKQTDSKTTCSPSDTGTSKNSKDKSDSKKRRVKSAVQSSNVMQQDPKEQIEQRSTEHTVADKPPLPNSPSIPKDKRQRRLDHQRKVDAARKPTKEENQPSNVSPKEGISELADSDTRTTICGKPPVENSIKRGNRKKKRAGDKSESIVDNRVTARQKSDGEQETTKRNKTETDKRGAQGKSAKVERQVDRMEENCTSMKKGVDAENVDKYEGGNKAEGNARNEDEKEISSMAEKEVLPSGEVKCQSERDTGEERSEKTDNIHQDDQENKATSVTDEENSDRDEKKWGNHPEGERADENTDHAHSETDDIKTSKRKKRSRKQKHDSSEQESSSDSEVFDPDVYRPKFRASGKLDDPDEYKKLLEEYRELRDTYKLEPYKKGERPSYDLEFTFGEKEYLHYEPPPKIKKSKKVKPKATENRRQSRSDHRESGEGEGHQSRLSRLRSRLSSLARRFVSRVCSCTTIKHLRPKVIH